MIRDRLIAVPFVQTNEWNPVFPILPLALLSFLAARLALGGTWPLPAFVFIASVIVQTHVAFVPEVLTLSLSCSWQSSAARWLSVVRRALPA